ncbi:hypothetical protein EYS14_02835 [Alteromonadaceae bacterium M269]|nr:hypothetical protein EYS14_02835 [Alteromonadaceae bacterium M269]
MVEQLTLDAVEELPVQQSFLQENMFDNKLRIIYKELENHLSDFGFTSLKNFREHVLASYEPHAVLMQWQSLSARR